VPGFCEEKGDGMPSPRGALLSGWLRVRSLRGWCGARRGP
jgi:hypothetical protein